MRNCKWCNDIIKDSYTDNQCDACWEAVARIDYIKNTPKLLEYFRNELKEDLEPNKNLCVVCGKNWVDVKNGFDTCESCLRST